MKNGKPKSTAQELHQIEFLLAGMTQSAITIQQKLANLECKTNTNVVQFRILDVRDATIAAHQKIRELIALEKKPQG